MSFELTLLAWSPALLALYMAPQALLYRWEHGVRFAASGRDDEPPARSPYLQRSEKALRNFLESYGAFIALSVAAELSHRGGALTHWGGIVYVAARVLYLPLYVFGVPYLRSLVWTVVGLGLGLLFLGVVL